MFLLDAPCIRRLSALGIVLAVLLLPTASRSQDGDFADTDARSEVDPWFEVEEMVVVGSTVVGALLDSSVSVTGFSQEDLVAIGAQDISDLSQITPNLEIRTFGSTTPTLFIRGVGLNDFTANAAGAIAVSQDDVVKNLPAIQLGQLFDTERVEVLRGPQGGGAGRNASGGAINIYSRRPTGDFDMMIRLSYGRFNAVDVEGALEIPITRELASRFAFRLSERDGLVKNGCGEAPPIGLERVQFPNRAAQNGICGETGFIPASIPNPNPPPSNYQVSPLPPGLEKDLNNESSWAGRAQLRWQPEALGLDVTLNLHGGQVDQLATVGQAIGTAGSVGGEPGFFGGTTEGYRSQEIANEEQRIRATLRDAGVSPRDSIEQAKPILSRALARRLDSDPFRGDFNTPGRERQDSVGGFVRGELELGGLVLTSITGIEYYDRYRRVDADYTPNVIFENEIEDSAIQYTQDLRLEGDLESVPISWKVGGLFLYEDLDFDANIVTGGVLIDLNRAYVQNTIAAGVFGELSWSLLDDLTIDTGARLNYEEKSFEVDLVRGNDPVFGAICDVRVVPPDGRVLPGQDCGDSETWLAPTGTISLRYDFTQDVSAYVKYSHGWKSGQYNAGGASGSAFTLADPERVDAYEIGLKSDWFDGALRITGSLFFYQYEEYQVFLSQNDFGSPPQRIVLNASDAQIYGAEVELDARPVERLSLNVKFGWLESKFLDFSQVTFRSISSGSVNDPPLVVPVVIDYTGNRLPNTPRFKVSGAIEYALDMGRLGTLTPRYDFTWTDDVFFDPSEGRGSPNIRGDLFMPDFAIGQEANMLHNLRLTYEAPGGSAKLAFWVRNLTNEIYKTLAFDASASAGLVGNLVGDPRTYGFAIELTR